MTVCWPCAPMPMCSGAVVMRCRAWDCCRKRWPATPRRWRSIHPMCRRFTSRAWCWASWARPMRRWPLTTGCWRLQPNHVEALNNRGYIWWLNKQDYARAIADLERAQALDPNLPYGAGARAAPENVCRRLAGFRPKQGRAGGRRARRPTRGPALHVPGAGGQSGRPAGLRPDLCARSSSAGGRRATSGFARGRRKNPHGLSLRRIPRTGHRHPDGGALRTS